MRFLLDENFPKAAFAFLEGHEHQAFDFRGGPKEGMDDRAVFSTAQEFGAILLTTDRDFFHTIPHLFPTHCGVVVIALRQPNRAAILAKLAWLLDRISTEDLKGRAFQMRDSNWIAVPPLH